MRRRLSEPQTAILEVLREERGVMKLRRLRELFPRQTRTRSIYRSVRRLRERGMLREVEVNGERWIARTINKREQADENRELLTLANHLMRNVAILARARGIPDYAVAEIANGADVDQYRHLLFEHD